MSEVKVTELYEPTRGDLWFRQALMTDPETMSYNDAWGGTIPFPEEEWDGWYDWWLAHHDGKRFYRYLVDEEGGDFVGEVAYHYDESERIHLADVIVLASKRDRGRGREGLRLLCEAARERGIRVLWDSIAPDNPAIVLFLEQGFVEDHRDDEAVYLRKGLS